MAIRLPNAGRLAACDSPAFKAALDDQRRLFGIDDTPELLRQKIEEAEREAKQNRLLHLPPVFDVVRQRREQMERDRAYQIETARLAARAAEEERLAIKANAQANPVQGIADPVQPAAAHARIVKKAALVAELQGEWPTIESDLSDAARNGLKAAAGTDRHGYWRIEAARRWAEERHKLGTTPKRAAAPITSLPWPPDKTRSYSSA